MSDSRRTRLLDAKADRVARRGKAEGRLGEVGPAEAGARVVRETERLTRGAKEVRVKRAVVVLVVVGAGGVRAPGSASTAQMTVPSVMGAAVERAKDASPAPPANADAVVSRRMRAVPLSASKPVTMTTSVPMLSGDCAWTGTASRSARHTQLDKRDTDVVEIMALISRCQRGKGVG